MPNKDAQQASQSSGVHPQWIHDMMEENNWWRAQPSVEQNYNLTLLKIDTPRQCCSISNRFSNAWYYTFGFQILLIIFRSNSRIGCSRWGTKRDQSSLRNETMIRFNKFIVGYPRDSGNFKIWSWRIWIYISCRIFIMDLDTFKPNWESFSHQFENVS